MLCHARLEVKMGDDAENVSRALKPDDPDWCKCEAKGGAVIVEVNVEKPGTLLSALDDYLMNMKMCERMLKILNSTTRTEE